MVISAPAVWEAASEVTSRPQAMAKQSKAASLAICQRRPLNRCAVCRSMGRVWSFAYTSCVTFCIA